MSRHFTYASWVFPLTCNCSACWAAAQRRFRERGSCERTRTKLQEALGTPCRNSVGGRRLSAPLSPISLRRRGATEGKLPGT